MPPVCSHLKYSGLTFGCCHCAGSSASPVTEFFWALVQHTSLGMVAPDYTFVGEMHRVLRDPHACSFAVAVALVLTAELVAGLSTLVATSLRLQAIFVDYEMEVLSFVQKCIQFARDLFDDSLQSLHISTEDLELGAVNSILATFSKPDLILEDVLRDLQQRTPIDALHFVMYSSISDTYFRNVYLPAAFSRIEPRMYAGDIWGAAFTDGLDGDASQGIKNDSLSHDIFAEKQERSLQIVFHEVLDDLGEWQRKGLIESYWPVKSTCLSLVRYGRLFGRFTEGGVDCVGDDLDFVVLLPIVGENTTWAYFSRIASQVLVARGTSCYLVGEFDNTWSRPGLDESQPFHSLVCLFRQQPFVVPVSFVFEKSSPPADALCSGYGRKVPCQKNWAKALLERFPGCLAVPSAKHAKLTVGNQCVQWMQDGFGAPHIEELIGIAHQLESEGFMSTTSLWESPECAAVREASLT